MIAMSHDRGCPCGKERYEYSDCTDPQCYKKPRTHAEKLGDYIRTVSAEPGSLKAVPQEWLAWSWAEVDAAVNMLAIHIRGLPTLKGLLALERGGLIPGVMLSHRLGLPLLTAKTTSYDEFNQQQPLQSYIPPLSHKQIVMDGMQNWLLVDDIIDTGKTLEHVRDLYPIMPMCALITKKPKAQALTYANVPASVWVTFPWESK